MKRPVALMILWGVSWLGAASPAIAQTSVEIQASAPEKPPQLRIVEPTPATREATRPAGSGLLRHGRPGPPPAGLHRAIRRADPGRHEVRALGVDLPVDAGRQPGLAGALGPQPGWFSLGLTVVWDSVPAASTRRVSDPR